MITTLCIILIYKAPEKCPLKSSFKYNNKSKIKINIEVEKKCKFFVKNIFYSFTIDTF